MRHLLLLMLFLMSYTGTINARSFSSSRSYSSSSYSRSYSKPSSYSSSKSSNSYYKSSTPKQYSKSTVAKNNYSSTSSTNKQYSKNNVAKTKYTKQDQAAKSKYGNKKNATNSYKKSLYEKNKYTSKTAPKVRPKHIPKTVKNSNGQSVNVTYNQFPGGGYGYGYYNPMGVFVQLAMADMMVDNMMMRHAGYGYWDDPMMGAGAHMAGGYGYHRSYGSYILGTLITIIIIIVLVISFRKF